MALINRVRVVWTGVAGTPWYSNFYFANNGADAQGYIAPVGNFMQGISAAIRGDVTMTVEGQVALIDSANGEIQGLGSGSAVAIVGADVEDPLPTSNQVLFNLNTNVFVTGRQLRGKFYMGGLTTFMSADGVPNPAGTPGLLGAMNELITLSDEQLVVWSKTTGQVAPVVGASIMPQFAVLRSRRD